MTLLAGMSSYNEKAQGRGDKKKEEKKPEEKKKPEDKKK